MNNGLPAKSSKRKLGVFVTTATILAALAWYAHTQISLEQLVAQEERFRGIIDLHPWRSFFVGFGIYTALSLIPGTGGKAIVYGWLFGFWQAVVIVMVSLSIAAMVIFSLSRYLFRDRIERRYTSFLAFMNKHIEREGALYLLTLRMAHAPFSIINPVSGASRVRAWTFLWTTFIGLLPGTIIWAYVGIRLPSLRELANSGAGSLVDPPLIAALIGSAFLPLLSRWLLTHFSVPTRNRKTHDTLTHSNQRPKT